MARPRRSRRAPAATRACTGGGALTSSSAASGTGSASRSATRQSTATPLRAPFARAASTRRPSVDGDDRRPAEPRRRDRERAEAAAEVGRPARPARASSSSARHIRVVECEPEPNAAAAALEHEVEHALGRPAGPRASGRAPGPRRGTRRRRSARGGRASRPAPPPRASPASSRPAAASSSVPRRWRGGDRRQLDLVVGDHVLPDPGGQERHQGVEDLLLLAGRQAEADAPHRRGASDDAGEQDHEHEGDRDQHRHDDEADRPARRRRRRRAGCARGGAGGRSRPA